MKKKQHNHEKLCILGVKYLYGDGVEKNFNKAEALYYLGSIYIKEKDFNKALKYLQKSSDQGHPKASFNLGLMYLQGIGVEKDLNKAREYFGKASALGDPKASFNLGLMYLQGIGVEKDLNKALEYFGKAADQGHEEALYYLRSIFLPPLTPMPK